MEHKEAEAAYAELFDYTFENPPPGNLTTSGDSRRRKSSSLWTLRSCCDRCCSEMRRRRREASSIPTYLPSFLVLVMIFVTIFVQKPWDSSSNVDIPRDSAILEMSVSNETGRFGFVSGNCHDDCAVRGVSFQGCPSDILNEQDFSSSVIDRIMPLLQNESLASFGAIFETDANDKNRYVCNGLSASHTGTLIVDTRFPVHLYTRKSTSSNYAFLLTTQFQEHDTYALKVSSDLNYELDLTHDSNTNTNLPIFVSLFVILVCVILGTLRAFWLPAMTRVVVRVTRSGSQQTVKSVEDMDTIPIPSPATQERLNGGDLAIGAPWGPKEHDDTKQRGHRRGSDELFQSWSAIGGQDSDSKTEHGTPQSSDSITTSIMKRSNNVESSLQKPKTMRIASSTSSTDTQRLRVSSQLMYHLASMERTNQTTRSKRLKSLDTFRGLALTIMIFVNYGGGGYFFFAHSAWNGLTVADLVFPWFMLIMGVSMALSFSKRKPQLYTILRRSFILFALGLFLNSEGITDHPLSEYRIPGVLQYFAVSFLVCGLTVLLCEHTSFSNRRLSLRLSERTDSQENLIRRVQNLAFGNIVSPFAMSPREKNSDLTWMGSVLNTIIKSTADIWMFWPEWIIMMLLLGIYLTVQTYLHDDSCPAGYLGAGGLSRNATLRECTGGAHRLVDLRLWGENNFYHSPTCKHDYGCVSYDPEGTLGMLTASTMTLIGVHAGRILLIFRDSHISIVARFVVNGTILCLVAALLCNFSQNDGVLPVNKNLWSPSFIFLMAGSGFLLLALCYVLIDVFRVWSGAPFCYVGMNSILIYCAHEILSDYFPFHWQTNNQHDQLMPCHVLGTALWVSIAFVFHRWRFYVKV